MNGAFFLDRDGTLIVDKGYLSDPGQIEFLPGAPRAVRAINEAGYLAIVISNQSGVARGMFDEDAVQRINLELDRRLREQGANIDAFYYCPHLKDGSVPKYAVACSCRKPATGLFRRAIRDFDLDPGRCYGCGDRDRDVERLPELGIPAEHLGVLSEKTGFPAYGSLLDFVESSLRGVGVYMEK